MMIKDWFLDKSFSGYEYNTLAAADFDFSIEKETEKAFFCYWIARGEKVTKWIPKSCIMTREEFNQERDARQKEIDQSIESYENLIKWAKEQGVKGVRKGFRKATILQKIKEAGLSYEG